MWIGPEGANSGIRKLVPSSLGPQVLRSCHDSKFAAHMGVNKTTECIRQRFFWPGLRGDVKLHIRSCPTCAASKGAYRRFRASLADFRVGAPLDRVAVDLMGPLPETSRGNRCILVKADYFTRWVEAFPLSALRGDQDEVHFNNLRAIKGRVVKRHLELEEAPYFCWLCHLKCYASEEWVRHANSVAHRLWVMVSPSSVSKNTLGCSSWELNLDGDNPYTTRWGGRGEWALFLPLCLRLAQVIQLSVGGPVSGGPADWAPSSCPSRGRSWLWAHHLGRRIMDPAYNWGGLTCRDLSSGSNAINHTGARCDTGPQLCDIGWPWDGPTSAVG